MAGWESSCIVGARRRFTLSVCWKCDFHPLVNIYLWQSVCDCVSIPSVRPVEDTRQAACQMVSQVPSGAPQQHFLSTLWPLQLPPQLSELTTPVLKCFHHTTIQVLLWTTLLSSTLISSVYSSRKTDLFLRLNQLIYCIHHDSNQTPTTSESHSTVWRRLLIIVVNLCLDMLRINLDQIWNLQVTEISVYSFVWWYSEEKWNI